MPHAAGLWYEWHGPEEAEVLILSAGLGGLGSYWAPNLEAFASRFRVLLYDHRGTGHSDRSLPERLTVGDMARDVASLLDALGIRRAHFVGHAAGGLIGLALASERPELVAKLVVVNGWARLDPHTARCFDVRLALLRGSGAEMFYRAQPIFLYPPPWASMHSERLDSEAEAQLAHFPGIDSVEKRVAAVRAFALPVPAPGHETLVYCAYNDGLVPGQASMILGEALPNARIHATLGGHACNVTESTTFNNVVVEFLGS